MTARSGTPATFSTVTIDPALSTNGPAAAGLAANSDSRIIGNAAPVGDSRAASGGPLPRSFLRSFLLLALDRGGRSYGYELFETVQAQGLATDMAGVYRALRAMQRHNLVTSVWEPSASGPDRRVYALSGPGLQAAAEAAQELQGIRDALSAALTRLGAAPAGRPQS